MILHAVNRKLPVRAPTCVLYTGLYGHRNSGWLHSDLVVWSSCFVGMSASGGQWLAYCGRHGTVNSTIPEPMQTVRLTLVLVQTIP